jgi:hypothetical protein
VKCFFLGKQKVILFPKYRENGWETAASALMGAAGDGVPYPSITVVEDVGRRGYFRPGVRRESWETSKSNDSLLFFLYNFSLLCLCDKVVSHFI